MNISEEKTHIYGLMKDITEERKRLTDMYYSLKERLDELNSLETRGLDELDVKGYVDLYNENQIVKKSENVRRELEQLTKAKKEPSKAKKEHDQKNKPSSVPNYTSRETVTSAVLEILKEEGIPVKIDLLRQKVNEKLHHNFKASYFNYVLIKRIVEDCEKLNIPNTGFIQYLSTQSNDGTV